MSEHELAAIDAAYLDVLRGMFSALVNNATKSLPDALERFLKGLDLARECRKQARILLGGD